MHASLYSHLLHRLQCCHFSWFVNSCLKTCFWVLHDICSGNWKSVRGLLCCTLRQHIEWCNMYYVLLWQTDFGICRVVFVPHMVWWRRHLCRSYVYCMAPASLFDEKSAWKIVKNRWKSPQFTWLSNFHETVPAARHICHVRPNVECQRALINLMWKPGEKERIRNNPSARIHTHRSKVPGWCNVTHTHIHTQSTIDIVDRTHKNC